MGKILIITDTYRGQINGVAVTLHNLAQHAESAGYTVDFIDPSNFFSFSVPGYKEIKLAISYRIGAKISQLSPDYIHIATEGPIGLAAKLYCDKHKIKYNTSYHTRFPEYLKLMYGVPEKLTYSYFRWFHQHSGVVLATTSTMCDILQSKGINAIPWTRGVDRSYLTPRLENRDTCKVLYVGRVSKEKNLKALLKLPFDITIVGDGPERKSLEKQYKANFVGYQTKEKLFEYYSNADVFCFPSKTDTFGIVMIESICCGTPVAAYKVPGPLDVVEEGINGYTGDCLFTAIQQAALLNRTKVFESSSKWTWQECWNIFKENLICK